jgi:biotin transport system substrate-specific component
MIAQPTVADLVRPSERRLAGLYDVMLVLGGSAWIALCTQIAFGWPVPVTGQTFAVLLAGAVLGSRRGGLSALAYVLEGSAGLPVFAHGKTGLGALAGPTGGYLVGFVAAACLVGALAERGLDRRPVTTALAMTAGNIAIYAFGLAWLFCWTRLSAGLPTKSILTVGLCPFIVGDAIKIALAALLCPAAWQIFRYFGVDKTAKMC